MPNPYASPRDIEVARELADRRRLPAAPSAFSPYLLICFGAGLMMGLHAFELIFQWINEGDLGVDVAIRRATTRLSQPAFAGPFLAVSLIPTLIWKRLRRRWFSDYAPTPFSRLACGFFFVFIFLLTGNVIDQLTKWTGVSRFLSVTVALISAVVGIVECEAIWTRPVRRADPRTGDSGHSAGCDPK